MQNPYAYSGTSTAEPQTPEDQLTSDYDAAIGANSHYYIPRFEEFDRGGSKVGWHWPAFFVTSLWFMYRKMWGLGVLSFFLPWILTFVLGVIGAIAADSIKGNPIPFVILFWLVLAAPSFLFPMFASALYWRHIRKLIERMPASVAAVPAKRIARLERDGRTGGGALAVVIAVGAFFFIGVVGILAAIAIPAYQDYTIRSQVTEGLNLAATPKAAVADYWYTNKAWPEHDDVMDGTPSGQYVTSVHIEGGSIVITYGEQANGNIKGKRLALMPGVTSEGDVVWICGNKEVPEGVQPAAGPQGSEVPPKYLPVTCRGQP